MIKTLIAIAMLSTVPACTDCAESTSTPHDAVNPAPDATPSPVDFAGTSTDVVWTCTGNPCPWGPSTHDQAVVWPTDAMAGNRRLGYTASAGVYLNANDRWQATRVTIVRGSAIVYLGKIDQLEKFAAFAALGAGESAIVRWKGEDDMVMTVESEGDAFDFQIRDLD